MVSMAIITKDQEDILSFVGSREILEDQIFSVNKLDNPLVKLVSTALSDP
jgi:hypothetical protein